MRVLLIGVAIVALLGLAAVAYAHSAANARGHVWGWGWCMNDAQPQQYRGMGPGQMRGSSHMMMSLGMRGGGHMMGAYCDRWHNGMDREPGRRFGHQNGAPDNPR